MPFVFLRGPELPKLGWVANVDVRSGSVTVRHGPGVETRSNFFVEGAWAGDFPAGDFGTTASFFGSGATEHDGSVSFVSSGSTTDYLYYQVDEREAVVSNSLPLLLAQLRDRLDPR